MPKPTRALVVVAALSGVACGTPVEPSTSGLGRLSERSATEGALCDPEVQIAVSNDDACPDVGDWAGEQLFDAGTPWLATHDAHPIPDALGGICRYEFVGVDPLVDADIADLASHPSMDSLSPSCTIVGGEGDALTDALGPALREIYRRGTGRASATDLDLPASGTDEPTVTVMVIDTAPADETVVPRSRHGRHMGNIVRDIACPDEAKRCRVQVGYTVGMPRLAGGDRDYETGGYVGTQADLASAIYEAVRRWEEANAQRAQSSRLVINLSLGWELDVFEGEAPDLDAADQAVRAALDLASCKGAMIVASAGNHSDTCDAVGPILPAAWESAAAPSAGRCAELGESAAPGAGPGYRPLVYAVGGLDVDLRPMPRARPGATPHLMASATHAVTGEPIQGGLTGTSVASASAVGAAALVWSYRPELDAARVMQWVYGSGEAMPGRLADFGLAGTQVGPPRRVDACGSLQAACAAPLAQCPPLPLSDCAAATVPAPFDDLVAALSSVDASETVSPGFVAAPTSCADACGNPIDVTVAEGATADCQLAAPVASDEFVNPTPGPIGCPTCGVDDLTVELSLHPDYDDVQINGALLTLTDSSGGVVRLELGALQLDSSVVTRVELDPSLFPAAALREATLSLDFEGHGSTDDALWIRSTQ